MRNKKKNTDGPAGVVRNRTFMLLVMCGIAAFLALGIKLFDIQVLQHDKFEAKAIGQQTRDTVVKASRGTIYDRNGKVLAASATAESVYIDPYLLKKNNENAVAIADMLVLLLGVDRDDILAKYANTTQRGLPIKRKLEPEEIEPVRQYISDNKLTSLYIAEDTKRYYPQSTLASTVIGFVGTDNYGLEGLEAKYDSYLTGKDGRITRLKNVSGTDMMFSDYENYFDATNGYDTKISIDATIQYYVEKHLSQAIEDFVVQNGAAAIAMDPKTGEILAMTSYGNYDLNAPFDVSDDIREALSLIEDPDEYSAALSAARTAQWRNKAISDTYEPGSVFKTLTLSIALEEGLVDEHSTFYCGGSMPVEGRRPVQCWRDAGHGTQTLSQAVENSCNVAFVKIGFLIGSETFYKYAESFGLLDKTGIDLSGEAGSIWWNRDYFTKTVTNSELAAASFGQTFNVTPIQVATAISAAVNGGYMYTPHVVTQITDNDGNIVYNAPTEPLRQVLSAETSAKVREILEAVVRDGTGKNAGVEGYRIGGKTGTSNKTAQEAASGDDSQKEYIVSFCGVAPMDDPQIVLLVLLDNPSDSTKLFISGGGMAAPVVGKMFADILPYLGVAPEYSDDQTKLLNVTIPKLEGKTADEVKTALDALGLEYEFSGSGVAATGQLPAAFAIVSPGTKVIVYMGEDMPDNEYVTVPTLSNLTYAEAKRKLEAAGLFIRSVGVPSSTSGAVVSIQSAAAGSDLVYGSVVEVTLVDKNIVGRY